MPTYQHGQWRTPKTTLETSGPDSVAVLTLIPPEGAPTTPAVTGDAEKKVWTANAAYQLTAGEWIERWTSTGTGASAKDYLVQVDPLADAAPSGQRVYASTADYANITLKAPPAGTRRALREASIRVDELLLTACYPVDDDGYPTDAKHIAALTAATVAQAEYAHGQGDPDDVGVPQYAEVQIGSARLVRTSAPPANMPGPFSAKAFAILQKAGLTGHAPRSPGGW